MQQRFGTGAVACCTICVPVAKVLPDHEQEMQAVTFCGHGGWHRIWQRARVRASHIAQTMCMCMCHMCCPNSVACMYVQLWKSRAFVSESLFTTMAEPPVPASKCHLTKPENCTSQLCHRLGPLGSRLLMANFMRHLHRRAAFFAGGMRDDLYQHFANIVLEIGIRECCQLANKSLRADWDAYPHSFLLYQEGHVQVAACASLLAVKLKSVHGLCTLHALSAVLLIGSGRLPFSVTCTEMLCIRTLSERQPCLYIFVSCFLPQRPGQTNMVEHQEAQPSQLCAGLFPTLTV